MKLKDKNYTRQKHCQNQDNNRDIIFTQHYIIFYINIKRNLSNYKT